MRSFVRAPGAGTTGGHPMSAHLLAREGGAGALMAVIVLQDTWRSLTKVQRAVLLHPGQPVNSAATVAALTRKGLWGSDGITELGALVAKYRPEVHA